MILPNWEGPIGPRPKKEFVFFGPRPPAQKKTNRKREQVVLGPKKRTPLVLNLDTMYLIFLILELQSFFQLQIDL